MSERICPSRRRGISCYSFRELCNVAAMNHSITSNCVIRISYCSTSIVCVIASQHVCKIGCWLRDISVNWRRQYFTPMIVDFWYQLLIHRASITHVTCHLHGAIVAIFDDRRMLHEENHYPLTPIGDLIIVNYLPNSLMHRSLLNSCEGLTQIMIRTRVTSSK